MTKDRDDRDWVETAADIAAALGFNRVRVRWKLDRLRHALSNQAKQTKGRIAHVGYTNKVCPHCTAVNDVNAEVCASCGKPLHARFFQVLSRVGIVSPELSSVSAVLGIVMVVIYARLMIAAKGGFDSIFSMDTAVLFAHGASFAGAYHNGEWYRLLTSVFLHAGLWHLGFNLYALSLLGPMVEEIFGKARMLLYFVVTGIAASLGSLLLRAFLAKSSGSFVDMSVAIGASGAIMGLMGIMAGWGQRERTSIGRNARNMALKWMVYTLVFGFFIGADNGAHIAGFAVGGIIGVVVRPSSARKAPSAPVMLGALLAALLALGATVACLVPLPSDLSEPFAAGVHAKDPAQIARTVDGVCKPLSKGDLPAAERQFYVFFSPHILVSHAEIDAMIRDFCARPLNTR